jgi:putative NIF3 family GTP cyclohydrolase 1 type 2
MYITADLKYHDFFLSEDKIILCDIGHYESEKWVKDILAQTLNDFFPNFATVISSVNTNPINYF